jgi:acetolactate synthase-1/2/3 large subunit
MTTMRGADAIAKTLKGLGVEVVFGMCGHGDLPILDAMIGSGIRFISCHHEQIAAHAADAYFRVSHRPGVVLTTLCPGMMNTVTALGDAALDGSAVVVISADIPDRFEGFGAYQEVDLNGGDEQHLISRPVTKRSYRVADPGSLSYTVARAWTESLSGCPGPVHLHVPLNFMSAKGEYRLFKPIQIERPALGEGVADRILDRLMSAKRPVIYAGGGVITAEASDALTRLAEATSVPVATSMIAQGAISESHPLSLGFTGAVGAKPANHAVRNADLVLAVGTRFSEMDSSSWHGDQFISKTCDLIHIDIDPRQLGRVYVPVMAAVADAREALTELASRAAKTKQLPRKDYWGELNASKDAWSEETAELRRQDEVPFQPPFVIDTLRRILPDDAIFVSGVGVRHMVGQHYPVRQAGTMLVASGLSTMGWEMGAALGAKVARPEAKVVGFIGDGAFNSTVSALPTAVAEGINVTWVLLDNGGYQCIGVYQDRHYGRRIATDFQVFPGGGTYQIDYVGLARAYGADGESVDNAHALEKALRGAVDRDSNYLVRLPIARNIKPLASGTFDVNAIAAGETDLLPAVLR